MTLLGTRIAAAAGLISSGALALGATSTTTFEVSAEVVDACRVAASALRFGRFAAVNDSSVEATTRIDVTCSNGTSYDIGLDAGSTAGATVTSRRMKISGSESFLDYSLYSDRERTRNWGETVNIDTVSGTGDGSTQTHVVYGRIPSGQQAAPVGSYSDTITVTVTY